MIVVIIPRAVYNTDDIIDSRDIMARIDYLATDVDTLDDDEREELATLMSLADEGTSACGDWDFGAALIRDSYFESYAQELAEGIGAIDPGAGWPAYCIDWERAARDLQVDYTPVDFDGETYWVHS